MSGSNERVVLLVEEPDYARYITSNFLLQQGVRFNCVAVNNAFDNSISAPDNLRDWFMSFSACVVHF